MQWKRMFRYLVWLVYTITIGSLAVGVTSLLCIREGLVAYWGILFVAAYAMIVAGAVFLLCRTAENITLFAHKNRSLFVVLEVTLVATFVVIGLLFRTEGIEMASGGESYYEMAKVAMGQGIPKIVHGAVYWYLQLLHAAFTLFGNYYVVGIWIQILLQMIASMLLFLIVRKLAGAIAALVTLGCCMCAPYMVRNALTLSPEMLYFCFLAAAVAIMVAGYTGKRKPLLFLPMGIFIALYIYMDILGLVLLIPAFYMVCYCQEEQSSGKMKAVAFCVVGLCIGFLSCIFLDAVLSGTSILKVAQAWFLLYSPENFRIPAVVGGVASDVEGIVLLGVMIFGIFSFWHDPEKERMTACVVAVGIIMLAGSLGVLTNEMPGSFSLYVLFIVLAGVGVGQCFRVPSPGQEMEGPDETESSDTVPELTLVNICGDLEMPERDMQGEAGIQDGNIQCEADIQQGDTRHKADIQEGDIRHKADMQENSDVSEKKVVKYIENPLPLPKKHVKRVLEYSRVVTDEEDFDHAVTADDDFDI